MSKSVSISYSSASTFKSCPQKYYLSRKYQTKQLGSSLVFGKAVEVGVEALFKGATLMEALTAFDMAWTKNPDGRQVKGNLDIEYYASDYAPDLVMDDSLPENWEDQFDDLKKAKKERPLTTEEQQLVERVNWACCRTRGMVMIEAFNSKLLPKFTLIAAQIPANLEGEANEGEDPDSITGYIDFVLKEEGFDEPIIVDLKTAGAPYELHALETSEQLRTYIATKGHEFKTLTAGYIVLLKKIKKSYSCDACGAAREGLARNCKSCKKGTYSKVELEGDVQYITKTFTEEEEESILQDYSNIITAVKNEITFKNSASCNNYHRECEYYQHCWAGKALESLEHLELKEKKS